VIELSDIVVKHQQLAEVICTQLKAEIDKLGLESSELKNAPRYDEADYQLIKDPYTGTNNLVCYWYDHQQANRQRIGRLQFNSDGSFYAEYDVLKPHPVKTKFFVEGVTAWGQAENIKSEAKLIPMV
jgi:hypothetical protein